MSADGFRLVRRFAAGALGGAALALAVVASVHAQPLTSTLRPIASSWFPRWLDVPDVARSADGSYLVVWQDGTGVSLQAFSADGSALAEPTPVDVAGQVFAGRVAALPDGSYVVAWIKGTSSLMLHVRLFDHLGAALGPAKQLGVPDIQPPTSARSHWDMPAAIAADAAGAVTVAWTSGRRIRLDRFAAAGGQLSMTGMRDLGPGFEPSLAATAAGLVVAWWRGSFPSQQVLVRRLGLDGSPLDAEQIVEAAAGQHELGPVRVTADVSGRFLVVWNDADWQTGNELIRGRRFAADGTPLGAGLDLVSHPLVNGDFPGALVLGDVAARPDGAFLLSWTQGRDLPICGGPASEPAPYCDEFELLDVFARAYRADGTMLDEAALAEATKEVAGGLAAGPEGWLAAVHAPRASVWRVQASPPCGGGERSLCLRGRFRVDATWRSDDGAGVARPLGVSSDTGAFWFFSSTNVELVVKVLDGTGVNGKQWVFFGSLTDVELDLMVTDTATGNVRVYHNPRGTMASRADVDAFDIVPDGSLVAATSTRTAAAAESSCAAGALCLGDGRFAVSARWRLADGTSGAAAAVPWSGDTGTFWFFDERNVELAVKLLDGRAVNGRFWVFFASMSDVEFDLEVLDTVTGQRRTYHNVQGTMASRADVDAF